MTTYKNIQSGKTYRATLKGVPSVKFEVLMRYVSQYGEPSADVTINPGQENKQIGGFRLIDYDFEEIVPTPVLPTGNYAVVGPKKSAKSLVHYTLHNDRWWRIGNYYTEEVSRSAVREALNLDTFEILFEGVPKDDMEGW